MTPVQQKLRILLIEDNPIDVLLVRRALELHHVDCELSYARDGEQAMAAVRRAEAGEVTVDLMLVDLNLPRYDGGQIVAATRSSSKLGKTPIILLTSSDSWQDYRTLIGLGVNRYFHKPADLGSFMEVGQLVKDVMSTGDLRR